ncbi:hypothetical protein Tco_0650437 [Tanacetum coccineum]
MSVLAAKDSIKREFVGDAGGSGATGQRTKKKRVTRESERTPPLPHPPRDEADYGITGGSAARALPTLPFITSSVTASPLEEGGDHTDSSAKSAEPEVDSLQPFTRKSGSKFIAERIRAVRRTNVDLQEDLHPERRMSLSRWPRLRTRGILVSRLFEGFATSEENFHPHFLNAIAGRRWLLTYGMKLLMAKCLNSTEYMEALGNAFGRAIEKGMQEGLAAGIEHGQAGRCLSDLEAYNPSAEANFNSAVYDLRGLDFLLLRELSAKKDASTWDVMDLLSLDDAVAEVSEILPFNLRDFFKRVRKMERNLAEHLPLLKDVFVSLDHPVSAKALAILPETSTEPPVTTLITTALSTMVIRPNFDHFLLVEDYENPDLAGAVPKDVILGPEGEGKVEGSTKGDVDDVFSRLENEARDAVL